MVLALLAAVAAPSRAGDTTPTTSPNEKSFAALKDAYDDAKKAYHDEFEAAKAKGDTALKAFTFEKPRPGHAFAPKFLAVAEKDPEGPDAVDALRLAMRYNSGDTGNAPEIRARAIKILREH
jgi:hypothetical protein